MLGLVLLYWIGKHFYKLAEEYRKSQWGFTILGIIAYYGGIVFFSFTLGIVLEIISPGYVESINEFVFGILMIPFGLLTCYLLYLYLEKTWKRKTSDLRERINEISVTE